LISGNLQQRDSHHDHAGVDGKEIAQLAGSAGAKLHDAAKGNRTGFERKIRLAQLIDESLLQVLDLPARGRRAREWPKSFGLLAASCPPPLAQGFSACHRHSHRQAPVGDCGRNHDSPCGNAGFEPAVRLARSKITLNIIDKEFVAT
jgi:hypothetical protein